MKKMLLTRLRHHVAVLSSASSRASSDFSGYSSASPSLGSSRRSSEQDGIDAAELGTLVEREVEFDSVSQVNAQRSSRSLVPLGTSLNVRAKEEQTAPSLGEILLAGTALGALGLATYFGAKTVMAAVGPPPALPNDGTIQKILREIKKQVNGSRKKQMLMNILSGIQKIFP